MPLPIITVAQMRDWENQTWAAGIAPEDVIQKAGLAFGMQVTGSLLLNPVPVLVLAGKGHNGDDARAAAQCVDPAHCTVIQVNDPAAALPEVQAWLARQSPDRAVVVDGLFGIGLNRPLEGGWIPLIQCLNDSGLIIASVDVPSGLDADTGQPLGAAIKAALTVTFGAPKAGLIKPAAAEYVGKLAVAPNIGLVACPFTTGLQWTEEQDFSGFPPRRAVTGHKGTYGHLGILGGSLGYHGAAVLAALGAQRAQPGLITLTTPAEVYMPVASQLQAAMVKPWVANEWNASAYDAVLAGPGLANPQLDPALRRAVMDLWKNFPGVMVADASALDWLKVGHTQGSVRVITPHPGEAARMLGVSVASVQSDRLAAARMLSEKYGGCIVVLKGHQTVVGSAGQGWSINSTGNPYLAQGGAGDLLAGWLAGWLAQPAVARQALLAVRYAVWKHGAAADEWQLGGRRWTVDDLVKLLG